MVVSPGLHNPAEGPKSDTPELADLRRYGRRLLRRFVATARADEQPTFARMLAEHLGVSSDGLPLIEERWASYEHVNVQAALDAWLAEPGRRSQVVGMANYRHRGPFGLGDLIRPDVSEYGPGPRPGNLSRVRLPVGPDGEKLQCLRAAVLLVTEADDDRIALLYRGSDRESDMHGVTVEAIASRPGLAQQTTERLRELADEHNVFRGQVLSFGQDMFGEHGSVLRFHQRRAMPRSDLILPETTFADLRRQVIGVALNRDRLRASGQHLKRGLLLHGPPGVGKTHTVRYLIGELGDTTVIELTGDTLPAIKQACSIARSLEPAMIVVEDVDLIAEQRDRYGGESPLLFTLLNEMDGLAEDSDVVFLLTTNRADLLEPALAARPGRVDQAVHIDLPDRDARVRLVRLYCRGLDLDTTRLDDVLDRTEGVTASFLKELLRRSAVVAGDRDAQPGSVDPLHVTADDLDVALADLLHTRNQMTRAALGLRVDDVDVP